MIHLPHAGGCEAGIDRQNHALAAEAFSAGGQNLRIEHGSRVDAYFICSGEQDQAHIVRAAYAAAHGEGQEDLIRHAAHHIGNCLLPCRAGDDIQEDQLVGAHPVVSPRLLDRVSSIAQVDEVARL